MSVELLRLVLNGFVVIARATQPEDADLAVSPYVVESAVRNVMNAICIEEDTQLIGAGPRPPEQSVVAQVEGFLQRLAATERRGYSLCIDLPWGWQ